MQMRSTGILLILFLTLTLFIVGCNDDDDVSGPGVVVAVSPASVTMGAGGTQQFTATVTGTTNTDVTWSVDGEGPSGVISSTGLYTAPGGGGILVAGSFTVRATSVADTTKSGTAVVTINIPDPGDWSPES